MEEAELIMKRAYWLSCMLPLLVTGKALAACPFFPADNVWNTSIDQLPLDPRSTAYINSIGPNTGLHPDFGSGNWNGGPIGIPYAYAPGQQPRVPVSFDYADESDPGPYPIPPDAPIEGGPASTGDRHVLLVDTANCTLYETWDSYPQPDGSWRAGSGAVFTLNSNALRPAGWTSADAAGLPILPGLARCEEIASGAIHHALRFTAARTQKKFIWPARHYASSLTDPNVPPMGQRFRLKAAFDSSRFSPQTQIILTALKTYGMLLADNGSNWYISGAPGACWDDDRLVSELRVVKGSDFEVVDESSLMVNPDSGQARTTGPTLATLTVSKLGDGTGYVSSNPAGIDCGAACTANFYPNTPVKLTATPTAGSVFYGWDGACKGTALSTELTPAASTVCSATFGRAPAGTANLVLSLTQQPNPVKTGSWLNYTITAKNQGPSAATLITLTETLPAGFTFVRGSAGCTYASGIVNCRLGTLASGVSKALTITVKPTLKGTFSATARVTSSTPDPDTRNNEVRLTTVVQGSW